MNSKQLLARAVYLLSCLLLSLSLFSQTKQITGKVKDIRGQGVIGASVVVKGSQGGTTTNNEGDFSLTVPQATTTLVISAVGFAEQEVNVASSATVDITLIESTGNLNEVVVVGYGTARRKDLTGSVASVQAKDFNTGQINTPEQLLQGKTAGVQITNSSGQPGGLTIVRIRGNNSIRTGNTPLYVVDGVPLDGRTPRPGFSSNSGGTSPPADPLTFINPNEIASIEILKDASAAAIYGSRGANGVILITTKKGASGPAKVDANLNVGFGDVMRKIDVLSPDEYRAALDHYGANNTDSGANINAFDEITRTAFTQNYSIALSGGSESSKYRASFFLGDQDGTILKTNLKKYVGNFNGQFKFLDDKLTLDFGASVAHVSEIVAPISQDAGSNGNLISLALIWNPTLVLRRPNGTYNQSNPSGQVNPLALSDAVNDRAATTTLLGNVNAAYKILPWLEYRFLYGVNYGEGGREWEMQGWIKGTGGDAPGKGAAAVLNNRLFSQTITHTLNINKDLSDDFRLNAVAGYEYWKSQYQGRGSYVFEFKYNIDENARTENHYYDNLEAGNRANLNSFAFKEPVIEIQSYFARAILNYQDRFVFTGTFRADGSSKFGSDNKYGYFPSFAAAWNMEKESFLQDQDIFDALKLRVGYGWTGNQEFPPTASLDVFRYNSFGALTGVQFGNPALKWETVQSLNVGLDFSIFNNRIYGFVDYFHKKTKDPITLFPVPQPTGAGASQYKNIDNAFVTNSGVEVSLGGDILTGKAFTFSANGNITFVKNNFDFAEAGETYPFLLTGGLHGQGTSGAFSQAIAHNQPINVYYLPVFNGFDHDGIGTYSTTPQFVGDPNPKAYYGLNFDFGYKKWSLNLGSHGAFGNKLYNNTAMSVLNIGNINGGRNMAADLANTDENPANYISTSTRYLENGSYFKLHNATIRFRVGDLGKSLKNLNIFVAGNNLFVISKYKGFDPEVNVDKALNGIPSLGVDYIGYPTQRTFLFGASFTL
jgi:TonB-dependent starch-binding outer membrane protein SusC